MVTGLISGGDPAGDEMFTGGLRRVAWGNSKMRQSGRSSATKEEAVAQGVLERD